jgi:hypothetical protein
VRNALRYVLLNAQRHAPKDRPKRSVLLDPASSARWFDGWRRGLSLTRATKEIGPDAPRPVARARLWLLTVGWRRHGLIDPCRRARVVSFRFAAAAGHRARRPFVAAARARQADGCGVVSCPQRLCPARTVSPHALRHPRVWVMTRGSC